MRDLRVTTWNLKQAVAPRKPVPFLWAWLDEQIEPDIAVLTEAKVPGGCPPEGWAAVWRESGIGPRRRWGTVVAARPGIELEPITSVRRRLRTVDLDDEWPGTVVVADAHLPGGGRVTIAGIYAITLNLRGESCGNGRYSARVILESLRPLLGSRRHHALIVAGDLNLWPAHLPARVSALRLHDAIEMTAHTRDPLAGCSGCTLGTACGHLWTHRNGNSPNAQRQQLDYIFVTEALAGSVSNVYGGSQDFPEIWELSDHAPVVADLRL